MWNKRSIATSFLNKRRKDFQKSKVFSDATISTLIGEDLIVENATLNGSGTMRIDGKFSGSINIDGHIILGETAVVIGDMYANSALLGGKYEGNLFVRNTMHLAHSANVTGHFETGKMIVDEGAVLNGTCIMNDSGGEHSDNEDSGGGHSDNEDSDTKPFKDISAGEDTFKSLSY